MTSFINDGKQLDEDNEGNDDNGSDVSDDDASNNGANATNGDVDGDGADEPTTGLLAMKFMKRGIAARGTMIDNRMMDVACSFVRRLRVSCFCFSLTNT